MKISKRIGPLFVFLLGLFFPACVVAQNVRPLGIGDLLFSREFSEFTAPAWSPDQQWLVYAVKDRHRQSTPDSGIAHKEIFFASRDSDLYAANTPTGKTVNLTDGKGDNGSPSWSPDGHYLAFLSDRDGSGIAKLWLWQRYTGTLKKVSDLYIRATKLRWLNNREVLVTLLPDNSSLSGSGKALRTEANSARGKERPTVRVYCSLVCPPNTTASMSTEPWSLDVYRSDLALIDIHSGKVRRLTNGLRLGTYAISPDASRIAFSSPIRFEQEGSQQILWTLSVVAVATGKVRTLANNVRLEYDGSPFSWSPDSSRLAYLTGGPLEHAAIGDLYVINLKQGVSQNLSHFDSPPGPEKQRAPLWDAKGMWIFFIRNGSVWKVREGEPAMKLSSIEDRRVVEIVSGNHRTIWSPEPASLVVLTYDDAAAESGFYRVNLTNGTRSLSE